ncbi:arsenate reductase (Arc2) [Apiospora kogelbergensis]|uniref:arsenate reductase (Arc2) n=1 Tax=Apiospora kogelbergensis TaxID=1337665 RepID=UPI00312CC881
MATTTAQAPPWHAAYPAPRTTEPGALAREDVLGMLRRQEQDFVLVDLRRDDYGGGTIRGSINLPAQSLHPTMPQLYRLFKKAGVKKVVWYCGSSGGRGTRAAGWFHDYLDDRKDADMKSVILRGGVKGWAAAGGEYVEWMDGYEEGVWRLLKEGDATRDWERGYVYRV